MVQGAVIHIYHSILDTLFPLTPAGRLVRDTTHTTRHLLSHCTPHETNLGIALTRYQSPIISACIHAGKFEHNHQALFLLGTVLTHHLSTHHQAATTLLCPIPLHPKRERERGYNQVTMIARGATRQGFGIVPLLRRQRHTTPQSHLARTARLTHLTGAFVYRPYTIPAHITTVILLDDVLTTGATMAAARATLAPHLPPHVTLLCLAIAH